MYISTTSLRVEGLTTILAEPCSQRCPSALNVVGDTVSVSPRVVAVEVFVDVKDQVGGCAVGVLDAEEGGTRAVRNEGLCRGVVVSGKKDHLGGGTVFRKSLILYLLERHDVNSPGITDSSDYSLDGSGPCLDVGDVVRLVHASGQDFQYAILVNRGSKSTYTPKMMLDWLAYLAAMLPHKVARTLLAGPPCPTIYKGLVGALYGRKTKKNIQLR